MESAGSCGHSGQGPLTALEVIGDTGDGALPGVYIGLQPGAGAKSFPVPVPN